MKYASDKDLSKIFSLSVSTVRETIKDNIDKIKIMRVRSCVRYNVEDFENCHIVSQSNHKDLLNRLLS